jgi:hypothetical protein
MEEPGVAKLPRTLIAIALLAVGTVGQAAPPYDQPVPSAAHWHVGAEPDVSEDEHWPNAPQQQVASRGPTASESPADRSSEAEPETEEPLDEVLGAEPLDDVAEDDMPSMPDHQVQAAASVQPAEDQTPADGPTLAESDDSPVTDVPIEPEQVLAPEPMGDFQDPAGWDESYWQQPAYEPPAPTCTSGTWFNRGNWYARQDFVYMSRFNSDGVKLVADYTPPLQPQTGVPYVMRSSPRSLGFEPGGRLTLGRFLCRDGKNRDHTVEFQFFGLFDWQQSGGLIARSEDGLFSLVDPFRTTSNQIGGFNSAQSQSWTYDSEYDSYELNYVIAQRLGRDRLELTPNGEWVRKMSSQHTSRYIGGVRVMTLGEGFNWTSQANEVLDDDGDVIRAAATGEYKVKTLNKLLGLQFGHELIYQRAKFRFGVRNRVGSFINYATQGSDVNIVDPTFGNVTRNENLSSHDLSFMYDLSVTAAYHLRPNLSIRCGYEYMFLNQVALAPDQLTFTPPPQGRMVEGGALQFNGFSLGVEMVW